MPRHARLDSPGLLQHVICRGIERSHIFLSDEDREDFITRLHLLLTETRTVCYAWALLDNHFHLLLMPTEVPLAVLMRRLLTGYAVAFNRRHRRAGHLFQNRYQSIVCNGDPYLLELVRYIHLNPVRAGIAADLATLADYRWCGHRQLLGEGQDRLLAADEVLALFGHQARAARQAYLQFLADGLTRELPKLSSGGRRISQALDNSLTDRALYDDRVLGGGDFVERLLRQTPMVESTKVFDEFVEAVAEYFGVKAAELAWPSKARAMANTKAVLCFLAIRRCRLPGTEVAKRLGYTPSAVSRAALRGEEIWAGDEELRGIVG